MVTGLGKTSGYIAYLGGGSDTAVGTEFNDILWGQQGDDQLTGNGGTDVLVGGAGMDRLAGGLGNDGLYGGAADGVLDTFVFAHFGGANADAVYEFEVGIDKLDFTALGASAAQIGIKTLGSDAIVFLNGEHVATVVGAGATLTSADFVFTSGAPAHFEYSIVAVDDGHAPASDSFIVPAFDDGAAPFGGVFHAEPGLDSAAAPGLEVLAAQTSEWSHTQSASQWFGGSVFEAEHGWSAMRFATEEFQHGLV